MNRLLLMALAAAMLTPACGNNAGKETKAEVQESAAVQANVTHLTKADFLTKVYNYEKNPKEWKYEGDKPAIVDFYATWCGPCKAIAPVLEKLAAEYKGKIVVYKIDTDKEPELSAAFGIRSIPTLLFIPAKGTPQVAQGALPEETLRKTIDKLRGPEVVGISGPHCIFLSTVAVFNQFTDCLVQFLFFQKLFQCEVHSPSPVMPWMGRYVNALSFYIRIA